MSEGIKLTLNPFEAEAKFCKNCGAKIEDPAQFCPACGKPLVYYGKECG